MNVFLGGGSPVARALQHWLASSRAGCGRFPDCRAGGSARGSPTLRSNADVGRALRQPSLRSRLRRRRLRQRLRTTRWRVRGRRSLTWGQTWDIRTLKVMSGKGTVFLLKAQLIDGNLYVCLK